MIDGELINHVINQYFKRDNVFIAHQIDSYDNLIDTILPDIISNIFPISISVNKSDIKNIELSVFNIKIERPYFTEKNGCRNVMTPNVARLRKDTYSLKVIVDVSVKTLTDESSVINVIKNIVLCKIPIVVRSKYCVYKE